MTLGGPSGRIEPIIDAFRGAGGESEPVYVQHALSWARTEEEALGGAHEQWRFSALGNPVLPTLRTPQQFAAATGHIRPEDVAQGVRVCADLGQHAAWPEEYVALGIDAVYVFNVNHGQRAFIEAFGESVLPQIADQRAISA